MKDISFMFHGKSYKGSLATSIEEYPHYYWCYIDDPHLQKEVGDCISFLRERGGTLQLSEVYPREYHELLNTIKAVVEQSLAPAVTA